MLLGWRLVEPLVELLGLLFVELFVELLDLFHTLLMNMQYKLFVTTFALHHFELLLVKILSFGHRMIQMLVH